MKVWNLCLFSILPLLSSALGGEDTVAEDLTVRELERMVELLTYKECEQLLVVLSKTEENIFEHLQRLSEEKNLLELKTRNKRDTSTYAEKEAQCQKALMDWLLKYDKQMYYDRLTRALQYVGRTDIAIELGKNINQDKVLNLKRFVEDYHKYVSSLNISSFKPSPENQQDTGQKIKRRSVKDLSWRDLDLIVERDPVPPYQKGPLDVIIPVLLGLLLGFGGTFVTGLLILLALVHLSNRDQYRGRRPRHDSSSSYKTNIEDEESI